MKSFIIAELPPDLLQAWLQHVRDFDTAHEGCHFEIAADCPDLTLAEMVAAIRVSPGLTFSQIIELRQGTP